jgi:hypothetical protein
MQGIRHDDNLLKKQNRKTLTIKTIIEITGGTQALWSIGVYFYVRGNSRFLEETTNFDFAVNCFFKTC